MTPAMAQIKEPQDCSSSKHLVVVVKTEPYNATISEGWDEVEHSHDSSSEEAAASTGILHIKDEPRDIYDPASSCCNSSNTEFNFSTTTVEPSSHNAVPDTVDVRPTDSKPRDCAPGQSKTQEPGESSISDHEKNRTYKCSVCSATCIDVGHLEVRLSADKANVLTCNICQQKRTQTGVRLYRCDLCPAQFSYSANLRRHMRTHPEERPYKCDLCPAEFKRSIYLQNHRQIHTGEKPYKCSLCPAEFSYSRNMRRHRQKHTGEKPYKCDLCPADFNRSIYLQNHKQKHVGEKPYKCNLCPAEFSYSTNLQSHKKTHTGEKPHECGTCHAKFSRSRDLQRHMLTHTGEKPHKCDLCPAKFSLSANLQSHKQTHTGEKPYKCSLCSAQFTKKWSLRRHGVLHASEDCYQKQETISTRNPSEMKTYSKLFSLPLPAKETELKGQ
ncbi:zinc finger protein 501-like isoform X2 [Ornithodoros turicata]